MRTSALLLLLCFCLNSFGSVVILQGQASPLEYSNGLYYWPMNLAISSNRSNFLITIDGVNKICFANKAPEGLFEQASEINILIHGIKTEWNCFPYKTTVFAVHP